MSRILPAAAAPPTPRRKVLVGLALALALPGCGALGALGGRPLDAFELRAPETVPQARRASARDLIIEVPDAGAALDTERIMIRPNPLQAQYLPGARWTGSAPVTLQTVLVRAFEDANAFRFVGRRPLGSTGDVALVSDLTDFQAEADPDNRAATVRVRLVARLVREADISVLASRTFQTTVPVASTDPLVVVQGFNAATDTIVPEIVSWALGRLGVSAGS